MHYIHLLHLRTLAGPALLLAILLAFAIALAWRGSTRMRLTVAATVLCAIAGYKAWRHMQPFEQGVHTAVVEAGVDPTRSDAPGGPHLGSCPAFPADNVWNTPIDKMPKDKHSADYIASIGPLHPLHPDFGESLDSGIPYTFLQPYTKRVSVDFEYRDDSDLGHYPIPPNAPIEGGPNGKGDRHVILVDQKRCILYELFDAKPQPDGNWKAGSGIMMDLTSNALRADGKTSADAAGLPILPGLVRYEEVQAGEIAHALRFTIPHTQNAYVWPGRHRASKITDPKVSPLGVRYRLRADFDTSRYSKANQVILTALKKYGMFLADNGAEMFVSGVSDKRWDDSDLHKLTAVKAADFEAVDESDYRLLVDSARVDPLAVKR